MVSLKSLPPTEVEIAMESSGQEQANAERSRELKNDVSSMAEEASKQTAAMFESATAQTRRVAEQQKQSGAQQISAIARAIDGAADHLQHEMPQASEFVHDMARRLDAAATSLRDKKIDDLMQQAGDFARRQPAMFFAGAMLSGLALARFLKSSSVKHQG
jgi:hypothetical protein